MRALPCGSGIGKRDLLCADQQRLGTSATPSSLKSPGTCTGLPRRIVQRRIGPGAVLRADVVFVVPVHDVVAVLPAARLPQVARSTRCARRSPSTAARRFGADEGLGGDAAHGVLNQADGHVHGSRCSLPAEEIRHRRNSAAAAADGGRRNDPPRSPRGTSAGE